MNIEIKILNQKDCDAFAFLLYYKLRISFLLQFESYAFVEYPI